MPKFKQNALPLNDLEKKKNLVIKHKACLLVVRGSVIPSFISRPGDSRRTGKGNRHDLKI